MKCGANVQLHGFALLDAYMFSRSSPLNGRAPRPGRARWHEPVKHLLGLCQPLKST